MAKFTADEWTAHAASIRVPLQPLLSPEEALLEETYKTDGCVTEVDDPEVPKLIEKIYGIKAPATPRKDLEQVFLTGVPNLTMPKNVTPSEQLRLNLTIPPACSGNRLGVIGGDNAGFPNGRRLSDDVIGIHRRAKQ